MCAFSGHAGLLEFLGNTLSLHQYLVGDGKSEVGAHDRYRRPDDLDFYEIQVRS